MLVAVRLSGVRFQLAGDADVRVLRKAGAGSSILAAAVAAALSGCQKNPVPAQTIVMGDRFEVTVSELDQVLRAAPGVRKEEVGPARRALLQALIGQKLLAQAGEEEKLDRRPDVVQQLAAARRAILASSYIQRLEGDRAKPSPVEIEAFYNHHPALFKERMEFAVREFAFPLASENIGRYSKLLNDRGFDGLSEELGATHPEIQATDRTLTSNELPVGSREGALKLNVGSDVMYRTLEALHLGRIIALHPNPVSLGEARMPIYNLILEERRAALATAAVEDLKRKRNVKVVNPSLMTGNKT
ncbi:hypothetical protein Q4F19_16895 [Sphingomonas sp. BIUV-7]|uniref:Peptidyl-prolyl cis-trans isomerase, EpsD family n=1 Tax=Sphingomonas natans TaxID=3063330 RepID=A0ABT8YE56_9SPHN|nr:hypothetical protein [Sphingomonas sp. BIUV-7]MDO6416068.1 hypothetical protein [Sphingomonas sp. BIUV-7]